MGIITEEMADGAPPEAQVGTAKRPRKRKRVFQFNVGKHIMITLSKLVPTLLSNPSISNEELRDILLADEMRLVILEGLSPKEKRDVIKGVWTSASDDLVAHRMRTWLRNLPKGQECHGLPVDHQSFSYINAWTSSCVM